MIFETKPYNNYLLVSLLIKEANLVEAERFKNEMVQLINQGNKQLMVNFKNVDYIDSSFLGALVSTLKYAMPNGADIAVTYLNKDIYNLFHLIRMDKVFKVYTTLPQEFNSEK